MVMTSDNLVRDLREIDRVIAMLHVPCEGDCEDIEDIRWLLAQRRLLSALLAVRRKELGKKVISLEVWRYGAVRLSTRRAAHRDLVR